MADARQDLIAKCKAIGGIVSKDGSECLIRTNGCKALGGTQVQAGCLISMDRLREILNSNG